MPIEQLPDSTHPPDPRMARGNDRLTVVTQIHHDHPGRPTFSGDVRFDRILRTTEQPIHREIEVGEEQQRIETHWMREVGHVLIHNVSPTYSVNPSKEQKERDEKKIVRLTFGLDCVNGIVIRPNAGYVLEVEDITSIYLRCLYQKAIVNVYLFPV